MDEQQYNDQLLASAVTFLLDGGEEKAVTVLLSCTLTYMERYVPQPLHSEGGYMQGVITLAAPRVSYDLLNALDENYHDEKDLAAPDDPPEKGKIYKAISVAFYALIDTDVQFMVRASLVLITAQRREEWLALLRGEPVTNQGLPSAPQRPVLTWNGLRFRSASEVRIAEALERARVLFLPNCMARLGVSHRETGKPSS